MVCSVFAGSNWSPRPDSNRGPLPYQVVCGPWRIRVDLSVVRVFKPDHLPNSSAVGLWTLSGAVPDMTWERLYMHAALRFCANGCEHRGRVARPLHRDGRCRRITDRPNLCRDRAGPTPDRAHTAAPFAGCQCGVVL